MVAHIVEAEPAPGVRRQERVNVHHGVAARTQPDDSADHEIGERRMVIPAAPRVVALEPGAGFFVEVFADVGFPVHPVAADVGAKGIEVVARRHRLLRVIAEHVGEGGERLRSRERPDCAVPLAGAGAMRAELRVAPLRRRDPERRAKALVVGKLCPRRLITAARFRQFEIPWDKPDRLADVGEFADRRCGRGADSRTFKAHLEKFRFRVPERFLREPAERRGLG